MEGTLKLIQNSEPQMREVHFPEKCEDLELLTKMKASGVQTPWYEIDQ